MRLTIPLSKGSEPLFRQVYSGLRRAILAGAFRPRNRLPSTRELADQLGVSRTVVLLAFDHLLAEGYVEGRHGSGTYVARSLEQRRPLTPLASVKLRLSRFGSAATKEISRTYFPEPRSPAPRYDFSYRGSNIAEIPYEMWRRILLRHIGKLPVRRLDYGPAAGSLVLREAIAAHLARSRAVACDASQVLVVNGSQQALDLVTRVMMDPGDRVAIEDPQYGGTRDVLRAAGARLHPVPVDGEGLVPDRLPDRARLAFLTPSHQFPTGAILPLSRRLALLEWAKQANAVLIEDDYDGEMHYQGQPVESMQGLDTEGRVIYVGTFSRTIFPALRIGYLIAPKSLMPAFTSAKWLSDRHTAGLEQEALAEFISTGAYERHLRRTRRIQASRRAALVESIQQYLGDRVTVTGDGAGAHLVLWPRVKKPEHELISDALAKGVGVYGISPYFLKRPTRAGLMLGYARMAEGEIREGIRRLSETRI